MVVVTAFDRSKPTYRISKGIRVFVNNVNEALTAITITDKQPIKENQTGAVVVRISVVDKDTNSKYDWIISDERFVIKDGVLRLKNRFQVDYESERRIELQITAVDQNKPAFTVSRNVIVVIDDVQEPLT